MIKPTIGRVVIIQRGNDKAQPEGWPAFVTKVHTDRSINVAGFDEVGIAFAVNHINLVQDDDAPPDVGPYAEWIPYQKAQAAKHATESSEPSGPVSA
jgi:hypothetical protein